MRYKVTVIGGGPAGMMAAIAAAECGAKVCLIEHKERVGKKILSTGNGKCNLTNMNISPDCYRSDSKESCFCVIENFMPDKLREFFLSIGLMTKEKAGYVYPNSEQAATVLDALSSQGLVNHHFSKDEEIIRLRNLGKTYDEICKELKCGKHTVSRVLKGLTK